MKKLLLVIDMQKDFVDGSLGTKEAQQIVPAVVNKENLMLMPAMKSFSPEIHIPQII